MRQLSYSMLLLHISYISMFVSCTIKQFVLVRPNDIHQNFIRSSIRPCVVAVHLRDALFSVELQAYANFCRLCRRSTKISNKFDRSVVYHLRKVGSMDFSTVRPICNHTLIKWAKESRRGHSRPLKMVPFESLGMVLYSHSIVTMGLSCIISEIVVENRGINGINRYRIRQRL